jgi:hypothetical protein
MAVAVCAPALDAPDTAATAEDGVPGLADAGAFAFLALPAVSAVLTAVGGGAFGGGDFFATAFGFVLVFVFALAFFTGAVFDFVAGACSTTTSGSFTSFAAAASSAWALPMATTEATTKGAAAARQLLARLRLR